MLIDPLLVVCAAVPHLHYTLKIDEWALPPLDIRDWRHEPLRESYRDNLGCSHSSSDSGFAWNIAILPRPVQQVHLGLLLRAHEPPGARNGQPPDIRLYSNALAASRRRPDSSPPSNPGVLADRSCILSGSSRTYGTPSFTIPPQGRNRTA